MPAKIRVLSDHTINQIAAGEVIENPASVVKELVENSIDAGASEIGIEIQGGGRQLIRITDNGCGMLLDDALLCLERHATSKLQNVDDIHSLTTMGFRGEAIPSIASISKFSLLTCPKDDLESPKDMGTLIIVDGGKIMTCSKAPRAPGTTIEVKSLFFNVPVRKKFLRSPSVDANEIHKKVSSIALGYPSLKFHLTHDGKTLISTSVNSKDNSEQQLKSRIEDILGDEFVKNSTYTEESSNGISIEGVISTPSYTRHNRTGQYIYINKRAVHCPLVSFAVKDGFGTYIDSGRFPAFVLNLQLDGSLVDVNVHPQKIEVRLRQEHLIRELILKAVRKTLGSGQISVKHSVHPANFNPFFAKDYLPPNLNSQEVRRELASHERELPWECNTQEVEPHEIPSKEPLDNILLSKGAQSSWSMYQQTGYQQTGYPEAHTFQQSKVNQFEEIFEEPKKYAPTSFPFANPSKTAPKIIATINGYILLDNSTSNSLFERCPNMKILGGITLVNQKNSHARIIYERLLDQSEGKTILQQTLLIPHTIEMSLFESERLKALLPLLNKIGIRIEEFGPTTFKVDALPQIFGSSEIEKLTDEIIQHCTVDFKDHLNESLTLQEYAKKIAITASKSAISATKKLSYEEAAILLDQLTATVNPASCPYGKPTLAQIPEEMLAKLFTR